MWLWSFFLKELSVSGLLITETGSKGERSFTEQGRSGRILRPGSDNKESACQCRRPGLDPSVRKIPWRRSGSPSPVFLTGESHGQRSLVGYSPWGHKESDKIKPGIFFNFILYSFSSPLLPFAGTFMPFWYHPGSLFLFSPLGRACPGWCPELFSLGWIL